MSAILQLLRSHDIEQTAHQLTTGQEYVAADRYAGVADGTEIVDLFVGVPNGADVDALIGVTFGTGGLAHLDTTDNASIDAAGTALDYHAKGDHGVMTTTVEAGGTYSATGDTLNTIQPGTRRDGGPVSTQGARAPADVRLLHPGDGVRYQLSNQSGSPADFDTTVEVIELSR